MCGIAGYIDPRITRNAGTSAMQEMLHCIRHRGPDYSGLWQEGAVALGHNRLSIIDLSDLANQPMLYDDLVVVFNGEIYNYREIRDELQKEGYGFTSSSDTEVLLAAYKKWGTSCVNHFVGMWSFAVWDRTRELLFCSRDRFGIKPFYYLLNGDALWFGSEMHALKQSPAFKPGYNVHQIYRGLQMGWSGYHDETYYEHLHALPPAHNLIYQYGKVRVEKYWDLQPRTTLNMSTEESIHHFKSLFLDSVNLHMRSDVEVGGALSGGLDSASIASVIGREFSSIAFRTFTIFYSGEGSVDERPFARAVTDRYPNLQPYTYEPAEQEIAEDFDKILEAQEIPFGGSSPVSQYYVMKLAHRHGIKVLLDGQGSDEFLAGYMHSFYRLVGGMLKSNPLKAYRTLRTHQQRQSFSEAKFRDMLFKSSMAAVLGEQQLYALEYKNYLPFLPAGRNIPFRLRDFPGSRLNSFLYQLTTTTSLPTLLHFEDRNSMAFSLESRVPFLDHRLVEFAFANPDETKIHQGVTKFMLREAMKDYLPTEVYDRRDKKGFVTPGEVRWLRGPLRFLLDQNFDQLDFLDKKKVREVMNSYKKGNNRHAMLVWRLALLRYWLR